MLCTAGLNIQLQLLSDPIEKSHMVKGEEGWVPYIQTRWAESRRVKEYTKANRKLKSNSPAKHRSLLGPECENWSFVHTGKMSSHRRCSSVTSPKEKVRAAALPGNAERQLGDGTGFWRKLVFFLPKVSPLPFSLEKRTEHKQAR